MLYQTLVHVMYPFRARSARRRRNLTGTKYGLETSGLLQKIRLNELFLPHQEENWASHGWKVIQEKLILEVRALVEKNNFAAFTTLSW